MTPGSRIDRWLWPFALAASLAGMIGASLTLLWIAAHHPDPAVVPDAWRAERDLHGERAALARSREAGLTLEVATQTAPGGVRLEGRVLAPGALDRSGWSVRVRRERPAEGGLDAEFELAREGDRFAGVVPLPRPGRWNLIARASGEGVLLERRLEWFGAP